MSTVDSSLKRSGGRITEGEFRYDDLKDHQRSYQYQLAVCSEDCTAAVKKVTYNAANDTFSGFSAPLSSGIPVARYFRTDSFGQLKEWFESEDRASYVNVHMLQPLTSSSSCVSPFLLAAYGTSNTFIAIDIFNRWKWMFENSRQANVRIVAFATDCDPRYLHAMRFALGFFAETDTSSLYDPNDVLQIELPRDWSRWFFMRTRQLFFCMQDPVHLCTKLRNRMLSRTASLSIGKEKVSTEVLIALIQNKSKLDHGLVKTDIEPKDRQNFHSCLKISSHEVVSALEDMDGSLATQIYLRLVRSVVVAYIEHDTPIIDRIYHCWFGVFVCRIWWTWLETLDEKELAQCEIRGSRSSSFITIPALFSIELNAHSLLSISLLVIKGDLPESALSMSKYDSQACESTFRLARSMSRPFSSIVNFTIEQFLKRAAKLSVLTEIEDQCNSGHVDNPLQFPRHHKRRRKRSVPQVPISGLSSNLLSYNNIEKAIHLAFDHAYDLLSTLDLNIALRRKRKTSLDEVSAFVQRQFQRKSIRVSNVRRQRRSSDDESNNESIPEDESHTESSEDSSIDEDIDEASSSFANSKSNVHGMRVFNTIPASLSSSYFRIDADGHVKYIHKQTAAWLLTDDKTHLSSDRLKRVQQSSD